MDNICHTLAGATLGEAGLKQRTALGMGTLLIASNLPDIDIAVFATDTLAMSFRRGWSHGVLSMVVLPALLAAVMYAFDRSRSRRANLRGLLLLSYIGTWVHVFMDFLNSYGVRLLMPFSNRWFYGDALYIVDPVLYAIFGGAIVAVRLTGRRQWTAPVRPARIGLAIAGGYMILMLASNWWARAEVREGLARAGWPADTRFMVTPVFGNPFVRDVVVDTGNRYEKGRLWFEPDPHFRPSGFGVNINRSDPAVQQVSQSPRVASYLRWSRFPFYVVERTAASTRIFLNDYRYSSGGRDGWAVVEVRVR